MIQQPKASLIIDDCQFRHVLLAQYALDLGNTCDDGNDPNGCIFTQNLLVPDASADEINAAVAGDPGDGASTATE